LGANSVNSTKNKSESGDEINTSKRKSGSSEVYDEDVVFLAVESA